MAMSKAVMSSTVAGARGALGAALKKSVKRPPSGYILFGKAERSKLEGTPPEVMTQLGQRWKALGDAGQAPFVAEALKLKNDPPSTGACAFAAGNFVALVPAAADNAPCRATQMGTRRVGG